MDQLSVKHRTYMDLRWNLFELSSIAKILGATACRNKCCLRPGSMFAVVGDAECSPDANYPWASV
jgi:hypothetical protein